MSTQAGVEVLVVVTTEQIDHHPAPDFREELAEGLRRWEAAPDPPPEVVVDLSQVTFLDSTGVRELILAGQAIEHRGGRLVVQWRLRRRPALSGSHRGPGTFRRRLNQRNRTLTVG